MRSAIIFLAVLGALIWIAFNGRPSPAANLIAIWIAAIWIIVCAWHRFAWHDR